MRTTRSGHKPPVSVQEDLAELLRETSYTVGVAESLTGGLLSDTFAKMPDAATWFKGGVVAYMPEVKRRLLDIGGAPVVSKNAAISMAESAAELMDSDIAIAVTGVGGPGPEEGVAPGTVWMAIKMPTEIIATLRNFPGEPDEVCQHACDAAVEALYSELA